MEIIWLEENYNNFVWLFLDWVIWGAFGKMDIANICLGKLEKKELIWLQVILFGSKGKTKKEEGGGRGTDILFVWGS